MARRTISKNGVESLNNWGKGVRHGVEFSREPPHQTGGGKIYVRDLIREGKAALSEAILTSKAYVYVCGGEKSMSKSVEDVLMNLLGEAKFGVRDPLFSFSFRSSLYPLFHSVSLRPIF